jgi:peptidoglycan/LPS O-acetylase OafA/YrhL
MITDGVESGRFASYARMNATFKEAAEQFVPSRAVLLRHLMGPYTDPNRKRSAHGDSLYALDGIRGFATVIVIASHSDVLYLNRQGSLGVLLFFMLSGFVLTLPFADHPERMFKWSAAAQFVVNRALRIVPIFVVAVLFMSWLFGKNWVWVLKNVSFYGGWEHLWSVAEEVRFYALFPVVIAGLALLPSRSLRIVALVGMIWAAWKYRASHLIDMLNGQSIEFYFWFFLAGILACLLYRSSATSRWTDNRFIKMLFGSLALAIIVFVFAGSDDSVSAFWRPLMPGLPSDFSLNGWTQPELWCGLFGVLIFSVTVFKGSLASRWMQSWHMRHLGLLSYSLYLFHFPVLDILRTRGFLNLRLFIAAFAVTYVIAVASYILVEKPFLTLKPKGDDARLAKSLLMTAFGYGMVLLLCFAAMFEFDYNWPRARNQLVVTDTLLIRSALENYHKDHGNYPPFPSNPIKDLKKDLVDGGYLRAMPEYSPQTNRGLLYYTSNGSFYGILIRLEEMNFFFEKRAAVLCLTGVATAGTGVWNEPSACPF